MRNKDAWEDPNEFEFNHLAAFQTNQEVSSCVRAPHAQLQRANTVPKKNKKRNMLSMFKADPFVLANWGVTI